MKQLVRQIEKYVGENMLDYNHGLTLFLDYLIDMFDYRQFQTEDGHERQMARKKEESPVFFEAAFHWVEMVKDALKKDAWIDVFGLLYEDMYQSKSKASKTGQFFTPTALCDMLAACSSDGITRQESGINDSACGSGRLLLAHFAQDKNKDCYYVGEDIDPVSVKMCALNMMIHGMRGRAVCHDTLLHPLTYEFGYEVNEVRYPNPAPFFSIREISFTKEDLERHNERMRKEYGEEVGTIKEGADGDMLVPLWSSMAKLKEPETVVESDGQTCFF